MAQKSSRKVILVNPGDIKLKMTVETGAAGNFHQLDTSVPEQKTEISKLLKQDDTVTKCYQL